MKLKHFIKLIILVVMEVACGHVAEVEVLKVDAARCPELYGRCMCFNESPKKKHQKEKTMVLEHFKNRKSLDSNSISINKVDLNNDGKEETLVYLTDSCGSKGCSFRIFDENFKPWNSFLHHFMPGGIIVLNNKIGHYHSLAFPHGWSDWNIWEWNGKHYDHVRKVLMTKNSCMSCSGDGIEFGKNILTAEETAKILKYLNSSCLNCGIESSNIGTIKYDLNSDGRKEILVMSYGFRDIDKAIRAAIEGSEYKHRDIAPNTIVIFDSNSEPILKLEAERMMVLKEKSNSYHGLAFHVKDKDKSYWKIWKWNGKKYRPVS